MTSRIPVALLTGLLLAVATPPAAAQSVRGFLVDRLSGDSIAGADVHLLSSEMVVLVSGRSDGLGSFRLQAPSTGPRATYLVAEAPGFSRYLSDPLSGASLVNLGQVDLRPLGWSPRAIPEIELDASTVASWCAGQTDGAREAVVVGRVRDRRTAEGLAGVPVRVEWDSPLDTARLVVGGGGRLARPRTLTGPGGLYHFCRVPASRTVRIVAEPPVGPADTLSLSPRASAVNRADLVVAFSRPGERAGLFGRVVDRDTGEPVPYARVLLTGEEAWALTNDRGFFVLEELPTGVQILEVEHLAYRSQQHPVVLEPGAAGEVRISLAAEAIEIEGLEVTVRSSRRLRWMRDLERRRELGLGTFFDEEDIRRRGMFYLGDVLRETPGTGARVMGRGIDRRYMIRRVRRGREYCEPALYLNGRRYRLPGGLMTLSASEMEVVEVHRAPVVPPEFVTMDGQASACGVVSAWTRTGG